MKLRDSHYYVPYHILEKGGKSFADFSKGKNYYNQLAFLFEIASSRNLHTNEEVQFIIDVTKLYIGKKPVFVDAACGSGRHSRLLAEKGFKVYAFDASKKLLSIARKKDSKTIYKHYDFRDFNFKEKVNCVYSLWEAYNYLSQPADIEKFLENSFNALEKGGIIILDSRNFWKRGNQLEKKQARKYNIDEYNIELLISKKTILKDRVHDGLFTYTIKNIKTGAQNIITYQELVRTWSPLEIAKYSKDKFEIINVFGDFNLKNKYKKSSSNRMIMVLQKSNRSSRANMID